MVKSKIFASFFVLLMFCENTFSQTDPTTLISPNAIKIDIDRFLFITHGLVGIKKGEQEALIDVKGNFIVPWGKYIYGANDDILWGGLIKVQNSLGHGYIDLRGNIVIPIGKAYEYTNFNQFGLAAANTTISANNSNIDTFGKVLPGNLANTGGPAPLFARELYKKKQNVNRMLIIKQVEAVELLAPKEYGNGKSGTIKVTKNGQRTFVFRKFQYGYGNKFGKILLPVDYEVAREFTDGRAAVMKTDEFGVKKWGFIDTLGKLVIPLVFKVEPGFFHNGLALVEPSDKTEFDYAYIDKFGQIKIKIRNNESDNYYEPPKGKTKYVAPFIFVVDLPLSAYFINGYALWHRSIINVLLDTNGRFYTGKEFFKDHPIMSTFTDIEFWKLDELGIYFSVPNKGSGLIDFNRNILFPPVRFGFTPDYYSPYALAEADIDVSNRPQYGYYLDGVINSEGKFILIKEKKGIW